MATILSLAWLWLTIFMLLVLHIYGYHDDDGGL